jgi:hypothetical protein
MKAILMDEIISYKLSVTEQDETYSVIWHPDGNVLPEFEIVDSEGIHVEEGCQVYLDVVDACKTWMNN